MQRVNKTGGAGRDGKRDAIEVEDSRSKENTAILMSIYFFLAVDDTSMNCALRHKIMDTSKHQE